MTKRQLSTYNSEFKESSVKLAVESEQPISQTAKDLGISSSTLHTWVQKYSSTNKAAVMNQEHYFDEIKRLKKELAKVTQERDLLKKAAAYFAKETL